jgi:hypothetical protein
VLVWHSRGQEIIVSFTTIFKKHITMKGILKTRNFDSLKKLSTKRAIGKHKNLVNRMRRISTTILVLEEHGLLTVDQLWEMLLIYRNYQREAGKLYYVYAYAREDSQYKSGNKIFNEFTEDHVNLYVNKIFSNSERIVSNLPYELHKKYRDIIIGREKELELKNNKI